MSLQWTLAAGILYTEMAIVVFLLLPIISPVRWKRIFNSWFVNKVSKQSRLIVTICFVAFSILMLDAIREMIKYDESHMSHHASHSVTSMSMAREFRAQRNLYITAMGLFFGFVIKRLFVMISTMADLTEQYHEVKNESVLIRRELNSVLESVANAPSAPPAPEHTEKDDNLHHRGDKKVD